MKHDVGGNVSIKKTLMNNISVSFYCIDFLIALAKREISVPTS
jgi:hypothetical protein